MSVLPILSAQLRQMLKERGLPLPLLDDVGGDCYLLLGVEFTPDSQSHNFTARIPTINAFGGGDTKEEAALALAEAVRGYLQAFS